MRHAYNTSSQGAFLDNSTPVPFSRSFPSFPSDHRPFRSASADTRPIQQPPRQDFPDHVPDFPSSHRHLRALREHTPPFAPRQPHSDYSATNFKSERTFRDSPTFDRFENGVFKDFSHSFRERSPTSSSALLDLLQRYPSAKNSIVSRAPWTDTVPRSANGSIDSAPSNYPDFPSLHHSSRFPESLLPEHSRIQQQHSPYFPEGSFHNSLTDPYTPSSSDFTPSEESPRSATQDSHWNDDTDPYSSTATLRPIDVSILDDFLGGSSRRNFVDDEMNRSSSEWRNSFERAQHHFRSQPTDSPDQSVFQGFTTNGGASAAQLKQQLGHHELMKSHSATTIGDSLLGSAVRNRFGDDDMSIQPSTLGRSRRVEAPSTSLGSFWNNSLLAARSSSPTPPSRVPSSLSAAERLSMLKENHDGSSPIPQAPMRTDSIASRQQPFLNSNSRPNFSALDRAVAEMSTRGGCARFPTDEHALSPPLLRPNSLALRHNLNGLHSPSPDSLSETSSYGVPSGLPHPKPKHNVVEQLARVTTFRPNWPTTGSVSSRITELEKRPGTPTLKLAGSAQLTIRTDEAAPPLSPRSTVFRTKPVIHVDMGRGSPAYDEPTSSFSFTVNGHHQQHQRGASTPTRTTAHALHQNGNANHVQPQHGTTTPVGEDNRLGNGGTKATAVTPLLERLRLESPLLTSTPKNEQNGNFHYDLTPKKLNFDNSSTSSGDTSSLSDASGISRIVKGVNVSSRMDEDDDIHVHSPLPNGGGGGGTPTRNNHVMSPRDVLSACSPRVLLASRKEQQQAHITLPPTKQATPVLRLRQPVHVPKFHFPQGKPVPKSEIDAALRRAGEVFRQLPDGLAQYHDMGEIMKAFGLPLYWKRPIWMQVSGGRSSVEQKEFSAWWWNLTTMAHDEAARFVHVLSHGRETFLQEKDLHSLVLDVIHTHPGLEFYRKSEEFHEKYIQVVVTRMFWAVNRSWSGKITAAELRRSNLLENIRALERTEDINQMTEFFSYEHFYVVYCKFWEIDTDHDLAVSRDDFSRHDDGAILPLAIDRIFSGAVTRGRRGQPASGTRDLTAFTAFLLADEDKNHPTSVEYWFRVLDLDGDGRISLHEMETFYNQLIRVMNNFGMETMAFSDLACNLIDMIEPASGVDFTLADLKRSPLAGRFFNSFVNWRKFFTQESSEGEKATVKGNGEEELTEWERYCLEEYERMMAAEDNDDNVDDAYSVTLDD